MYQFEEIEGEMRGDISHRDGRETPPRGKGGEWKDYEKEAAREKRRFNSS